MSSRKQKTTTLLVRILKRKGRWAIPGCRTSLWHSHRRPIPRILRDDSWLCSWVSFLHRVHSSPLLRRPGLQPRRKPPQNNSSPNPFPRPKPRTGDFNRHERFFPLFSSGLAYPSRCLPARCRRAHPTLVHFSSSELAFSPGMNFSGCFRVLLRRLLEVRNCTKGGFPYG